LEAKMKDGIQWMRVLVGVILVVSAGVIGGYLYQSLGEHSGMFLQVILMGALGSHVTVGLAFVKHSADFTPHVFWWYPIRLIEGALVAVVFWMALRAGMLGIELPTDEPWSALSYAALGGMFSHTIIARLGEFTNGDEGGGG